MLSPKLILYLDNKYSWSKIKTYLCGGKSLENVFDVSNVEMEKRFNVKKYFILTLKWRRDLMFNKNQKIFILTANISMVRSTILNINPLCKKKKGQKRRTWTHK